MSMARNLSEVGYEDLNGRSGFKLAMQEVNGRFYLYTGALWEPGLSILEVTDPSRPRVVRWIEGPPNTWTLQVQVAEGKMITNLEHVPKGWGGDSDAKPQDGFVIWDVADPEDPKKLGQWSSGATGTHRNFYDGGRYVHAATSQPGFSGRIYGVVDIDDPTAPRLVGRWWYPGQHVAAGESFSPADERKRTSGRPAGSEAFALHGPAHRVDNRVYCSWSRAGMVILDISDLTSPQLVSVLSAYPPLGSTCAVHTYLPIPERKIAIVNDEALNEHRGEPLNYAAIVDISDERDPLFLSIFPVPEPPDGQTEAFFDRGGRFGPHNQHHPQGQSCLQPTGNLVYLTYFNAGLQVFDISDVRRPRNVGYFIPDDPTERRGPLPTKLVAQVEDVLVDRRGYIYISEKNSGIRILKLDGELAAPLAL
jgi:hypothetical protein